MSQQGNLITTQKLVAKGTMRSLVYEPTICMKEAFEELRRDLDSDRDVTASVHEHSKLQSYTKPSETKCERLESPRSGIQPTIRITPRPQQIMTSPTPLTRPKILQGIPYNRDHRPHMRQAAPQPISHTDMSCLQLRRSLRPEDFSRILRIPQVQVTYLWTLRC